ncbi:hypothetical protein [Methylobacterium platani]|uniref:Uncharacterized protein n=2 Tax=Methylobacterium platani TaxID=427683 RepID=A0A179SFS2_9HYPH|nr:hypothetical protein [Methylobacterium platani]KMO21412.1 hypothetical protein SQ03_03425 [Methylobacterium platani JCM 14648]OAS26309.1 hypothetical protein A5481_06230 [Methylobacterium platani]
MSLDSSRHDRLVELEAENAQLRASVNALCDAAAAIVSYDGDDAKPPITDLLLMLEAEVARARPASDDGS